MERLMVTPIATDTARVAVAAWHPLGVRGSLRGIRYALGGWEGAALAFVAVLVWPRARWRRYRVDLELSRLVWSPVAQHSAVTFLRKVQRWLRRNVGEVWVVTYALPGTRGVVYERAGWVRWGYSSGTATPWHGVARRRTVGTGRRLARFVWPSVPPRVDVG